MMTPRHNCLISLPRGRKLRGAATLSLQWLLLDMSLLLFITEFVLPGHTTSAAYPSRRGLLTTAPGPTSTNYTVDTTSVREFPVSPQDAETLQRYSFVDVVQRRCSSTDATPAGGVQEPQPIDIFTDLSPLFRKSLLCRAGEYFDRASIVDIVHDGTEVIPRRLICALCPPGTYSAPLPLRRAVVPRTVNGTCGGNTSTTSIGAAAGAGRGTVVCSSTSSSPSLSSSSGGSGASTSSSERTESTSLLFGRSHWSVYETEALDAEMNATTSCGDSNVTSYELSRSSLGAAAGANDSTKNTIADVFEFYPICTLCGANQRTAFGQGSTSSSSCICKDNFFWSKFRKECVSCLRGMECTWGTQITTRAEQEPERIVASPGYKITPLDPVPVADYNSAGVRGRSLQDHFESGPRPFSIEHDETDAANAASIMLSFPGPQEVQDPRALRTSSSDVINMNDNFSPEALWGQDPTAGGSRLPSGFVNVNGFVVFKCGATIDLPKFDSATGSITMEEILTDALIARCPGGHNACGYLHGGLTCRECSSTAGYDGETCSSCTDKPLRKFVLDNWLFSVMLLFLLTCVVLAVMYVITVGHEISSKASPAVFTGAFIGMTVQTFQTLAVFSSMKIAWPPEMQKIIASMRVVFLLELHEMGVGFECFAAASSFRHYLARIMMPFTVFSIYFGAYWLTRSREKARRRTQHGPEWSHTMHSLAERTQASLMARVSRFSLASFKSNMSALRFPGRLSLTSQASTVATGIYPGSGGGDAVPRSSTWAVAFQNRFAAGAKKVQKKLSTLSTRSKQRLSELRELKKAAPPDQVEAFRDDGELDDGAVLQADHSGNAARSASRPAKKMNHSVASSTTKKVVPLPAPPPPPAGCAKNTPPKKGGRVCSEDAADDDSSDDLEKQNPNRSPTNRRTSQTSRQTNQGSKDVARSRTASASESFLSKLGPTLLSDAGPRCEPVSVEQKNNKISEQEGENYLSGKRAAPASSNPVQAATKTRSHSAALLKLHEPTRSCSETQGRAKKSSSGGMFDISGRDEEIAVGEIEDKESCEAAGDQNDGGTPSISPSLSGDTGSSISRKSSIVMGCAVETQNRQKADGDGQVDACDEHQNYSGTGEDDHDLDEGDNYDVLLEVDDAPAGDERTRQFKHNKTLSLMPAKAHTASDAAHKNGAGEAGARPASVRFAAPTAAGDVGACGSSRRLRSRASQIAESQGEHSRLRNRRAPVRISAGSNERASDATLLFQLRLTAMQNMYDRGSSKDSFITGFSTRSVKENAKVVWSRVKDEIVYEKVFCCCGFFAQAFYISFAALGFVPFVCFSHPTSGGRSTLRSMDQYEDVFCDWEDPEYLKFVAAAIFAILCWPVGLLSAAVYLIRVAPERSVSDPKFLAQTKFLFFRFRPERYYWSVVLACRSLLTVLSIVIGPDNPIYQMSWMFILLLSSLVLQLYCWPWKDESLNTIDTLLLFSLLVLTMFAFPMIQVSEGDRAFFEKIVMHLFFLFIVVMVLVFLYGVNLVFGAWHLRRMRRRMASILAEEQDKTMGLKEKTACVIVRGDSGEEEVADHDRDQNINNTSSDGHKKKHIISAPTSPTAAASFLARTAQNKIANLLSKPYAMYQTAGEKQREKIKTISSNWLTTQSAVTKMSSEKFTALVERLTYYELRALESVLQVMERHVQVERLSVSGGASGSLLTGKKCLGTGQRISLESEEADNEGSSEEDDDNEDTCSSDESSGGEAPAGEARARDAAGDLCVPRDRGSRSRIAGASRAGADVGAEGGGTRRTGHDVDKTKPADRPHTTGCLRSTLTMKAQQEEKEREIRAKHDHTTAVAELLLSSSSSHEKLKLQSTRSSSSRPRANMDANKIGHARSSARAHVHPDRPSDSIFVCAGSISSEGVFNAEQGTFGVSSASNEFGSSIRGEFGSSITMTNTSASRARLLLSSETTLSRAPGNQSSLEAHVSSVNTGATYPSRQTSSARSNSHELIVVLPGAVYPPMGENAASQISGQSSNALSGRVSLIGGQPSTTKTSSMSSVEGEQNHQIDRDGRLLPRAVKFESTASSSSAGGQSIASGAMADVSRGGAATGNGSSSEEVRKVHQMVSVKDQLVGGTNANSPQPSAGAVSEREQRAGSEQPAAQRRRSSTSSRSRAAISDSADTGKSKTKPAGGSDACRRGQSAAGSSSPGEVLARGVLDNLARGEADRMNLGSPTPAQAICVDEAGPPGGNPASPLQSAPPGPNRTSGSSDDQPSTHASDHLRTSSAKNADDSNSYPSTDHLLVNRIFSHAGDGDQGQGKRVPGVVGVVEEHKMVMVVRDEDDGGEQQKNENARAPLPLPARDHQLYLKVPAARTSDQSQHAAPPTTSSVSVSTLMNGNGNQDFSHSQMTQMAEIAGSSSSDQGKFFCQKPTGGSGDGIERERQETTSASDNRANSSDQRGTTDSVTVGRQTSTGPGSADPEGEEKKRHQQGSARTSEEIVVKREASGDGDPHPQPEPSTSQAAALQEEGEQAPPVPRPVNLPKQVDSSVLQRRRTTQFQVPDFSKMLALSTNGGAGGGPTAEESPIKRMQAAAAAAAVKSDSDDMYLEERQRRRHEEPFYRKNKNSKQTPGGSSPCDTAPAVAEDLRVDLDRGVERASSSRRKSTEKEMNYAPPVARSPGDARSKGASEGSEVAIAGAEQHHQRIGPLRVDTTSRVLLDPEPDLNEDEVPQKSLRAAPPEQASRRSHSRRKSTSVSPVFDQHQQQKLWDLVEHDEGNEEQRVVQVEEPATCAASSPSPSAPPSDARRRSYARRRSQTTPAGDMLNALATLINGNGQPPQEAPAKASGGAGAGSCTSRRNSQAKVEQTPTSAASGGADMLSALAKLLESASTAAGGSPGLRMERGVDDVADQGGGASYRSQRRNSKRERRRDSHRCATTSDASKHLLTLTASAAGVSEMTDAQQSRQVSYATSVPSTEGERKSGNGNGKPRGRYTELMKHSTAAMLNHGRNSVVL